MSLKFLNKSVWLADALALALKTNTHCQESVSLRQHRAREAATVEAELRKWSSWVKDATLTE